MKKYLPVLLLMSLICAFGAYYLAKDTSQADSNAPQSRESSVRIDVDLTALSGTMAYAQLYNIMSNADDYLGKTIKMRGSYYASASDQANLYYHYVILGDAAACCEVGVEFIWKGEHTYPDDYPKEYASIEVVGEFRSYKEFKQTRYYLTVDDISILL